MNLQKLKITNKGLYWGLIITFLLLYVFVAFVSTLHAIDFFKLANPISLAILLGVAYEVGQASVLFSILMTKNKERFLPWALMFLLTGLQITANVYASFKHMMTSGSTDWQYWQKSILFGVQATSPEMYQVIISWISGALLPIIALGMTALVAQNIKMATEEYEKEPEKVGSIPDEQVEEIINNEVDKKVEEVLKEKTVEEFHVPSKYEDKFGPDFTKTMKEIYDEEASDNLDRDVENFSYPMNYQSPLINPKLEKVLEQQIAHQEAEKLQAEIKKRGRPPKEKEPVVEPKKEQEPLPVEEVKVPEKRRRFVNPLNKKTKTQTIKIDDIMKPSKGEEVIKLLENIEKEKEMESIIESTKDEQISQESILIPPELRTPYVQGGVEVIDAKAVPKPEVKKN